MATMIVQSRSAALEDLLANPVSFIKQPTPFCSAVGGKYTPFNRQQPESATFNAAENVSKSTQLVPTEDTKLPVPSRELFPKDKLSTQWSKVWPVSPGLQNSGNTCYMNSVLQSLLHTPPMVEYLLSGVHDEECRANLCVVCAMKFHGKRVYSGGRKASFLPTDILQHLKVIAKHFKSYRQEDAHEFLRLLIDAMQNSLLHNYKNLDHPAQQTTAIHRMFGGYIKQIVTCLTCLYKSETIQTVLDLSLDVEGSDINDSLSAFTNPEKLARDVKFKCEKCTKLVEVQKHTQIHTAPQILTLHLKRFTAHSSKINRYVRFSETLDLSKYIVPSRREAHPETKYRLYSVIVHSGGGTRSGHYIAYCKGSSDVWHEFDDNHVNFYSRDDAYLLQVVTAKAGEVLQQQAYILLYKRMESGCPLTKDSGSSSSNQPLDGENPSILPKPLPSSALQQQQPTPSPTPPPNMMPSKFHQKHQKRKRDDSFTSIPSLNKSVMSSFGYFGDKFSAEDEGRRVKRKDAMKPKISA
ncbi:putative ubiquitin carboxyl-terminal hydrolase 16 [Neolecta irregularis DAH-3]|uniref:Ubiquitin carboxyl-terminal hydrolase n=1 Tax=Neolecta irregularis (strain DAH-3) TaxID=1198029 RepID=A0A1U7LHD9_NEOID|nr:putative ubiquitin carboxyl-terminal hydrolase 16 [Neolecta irregularis DAH-3]|eukprot:OLL22067.1 putative ubiquitin carboxyl-terminal hydrolase 16 [Neolecta irregularis DAH-3]